MHLSTMRYIEPAPPPTLDKLPGPTEAAWLEVTKALLSVIAGYVLSFLNLFGAIALIWIVTGGFRKSVVKITGDDFTWLLAGGAVLFFTSLYSAYLLLRGKWRCVISAPERHGAKWLMFASMICVCAGPALNFAAGFAAAPAATEEAVDAYGRPDASKAAVLYAAQLRSLNAATVIRLAGSVIGVAGPIFFVLFLRAVHGCLGSFLGARFTELYLLFIVLLFAGSLSLLLDSNVRLQADLLIGLALGWVVATVWYFLLIVGTVFAISAHLNAPRPPQAV
jgi:hypothetical protein